MFFTIKPGIEEERGVSEWDIRREVFVFGGGGGEGEGGVVPHQGVTPERSTSEFCRG